MMKKISVGILVLLAAAFAGCGGSGGGSSDSSAGAVTTLAVTPVSDAAFQAGDAADECAQAGDFVYAFKIDDWAGDMNGPYQASFDDGHINDITIENSDGTYFDWSATKPIGAVIVKGGNSANIFSYDPQAYSDTGLYSPLNNGGNVPEVSHVTFCWNPEEEGCFEYESAWSDGPRFVSKGNWATYTPYASAENEVTLFAGQTMEAGTVTFSPENGQVKITISLNDGWTFDSTKEENVKIQGYETAPSGNPTPGQFTDKFTETGTSFVAVVNAANYYGVHVDVRQQVECAEEE
jgi:hypothetical protein